jgi:hypothetical protein
MGEYYDIRQEGQKEAWDTTPGATPEDWDKALEIAEERARTQGRNYVVRHVSRERAQLIVTATPEEGLVWPRVGVPPLQPGELDREEEPEREDYDPGPEVDDQGGMSEVDPRWDEVAREEAEYFGELEA